MIDALLKEARQDMGRLPRDVRARVEEALRYPILVRARAPYGEMCVSDVMPNKLSEKMCPPSVASAMIGSVSGKYCMRYLVLAIMSHTLPRHLTLTRNEPQSFSPPSQWMPVTHAIVCNCDYSILAVPYVLFDSRRETPKKFHDILRKRLSRGEVFRSPSMGSGNCLARVDWADELEEGCEAFNEDSRVFYGRFFSAPGHLRHVFFSASIRKGLLKCVPWQVLSDPDLGAVLGPDGDIVVQPGGRYRRAV